MAAGISLVNGKIDWPSLLLGTRANIVKICDQWRQIVGTLRLCSGLMVAEVNCSLSIATINYDARRL